MRELLGGIEVRVELLELLLARSVEEDRVRELEREDDLVRALLDERDRLLDCRTDPLEREGLDRVAEDRPEERLRPPPRPPLCANASEIGSAIIMPVTSKMNPSSVWW